MGKGDFKVSAVDTCLYVMMPFLILGLGIGKYGVEMIGRFTEIKFKELGRHPRRESIRHLKT